MKKVFLAGILLLATMTACQNDETVDNSKEAINAVKFDSRKFSARMGEGADTSLEPPAPGGDVVINCHTNYTWNQGNSCVSVGGSLYRVSWLDVQIAGENSSIRNYTSTKVSSCSCGL